jgi:hypothetical protein
MQESETHRSVQGPVPADRLRSVRLRLHLSDEERGGRRVFREVVATALEPPDLDRQS